MTFVSRLWWIAAILVLGGCVTAQHAQQQGATSIGSSQALLNASGEQGRSMLGNDRWKMSMLFNAMSRNPKMLYLIQVSPENSPTVLGLMQNMQDDPQVMTDVIAVMLAAVTSRYEAIYGKIYLPDEPAPGDNDRVRQAQRRVQLLLNDRRQEIIAGRQANLGALERQIQQQEKEIWLLRQAIRANTIQ